ncbi:hypothetical protein OKW21_005015 [Catalinimonas alkaloidigena]|uniref:hypothetical protein n=1 Tax=Catalinimonas alkaloidigena TaxID=1075417 RepID=UPI00240593B3|nr:hypothetical protein [Catalinimonas alkaloidigena]MDF9799752.1 hypothetical protein [Catalinimonas alkaloidigena]
MQIQLLSGITEAKGLREYSTTAVNAGPNQVKRLGVLIGLKIDWNKTADKLRWGYLKTESLRGRGLNDRQISNLKSRLAQAEAEYTKLGGHRKDFAKAIVEGFGNRDQAVKAAVATVDYDTLGEISIRAEERILLTSPAQLLADLKAGIKSSFSGLGNTESNSNADAFAKAGSTLSKISEIASGVSSITGSLATISQTEDKVNASIDEAPATQQAGMGSWMDTHRKKLLAGGALLFAGLFITQMKHADGDPGNKSRPRTRNSGTKKTTKPKKRPVKKKSTSSLGIIPLQ